MTMMLQPRGCWETRTNISFHSEMDVIAELIGWGLSCQNAAACGVTEWMSPFSPNVFQKHSSGADTPGTPASDIEQVCSAAGAPIRKRTHREMLADAG